MLLNVALFTPLRRYHRGMSTKRYAVLYLRYRNGRSSVNTHLASASNDIALSVCDTIIDSVNN